MQEICSRYIDQGRSDRLAKVLAMGVGPTAEGRYRHWDELRHLRPPEGLTSEEWWTGLKFARSQTERVIPLEDRDGEPFRYSTPDSILKRLHEIDRDASGRIELPEAIANPQTKDRYVRSSLIEEAVMSSQLEGAVATREQAKEMIRSGRRPVDHSERMILNNYRAMQLIGQFKDAPLSPEVVFQIHERITGETLPPEARAPYLRQPGDDIAIYDEDDTLLHRPPVAEEIPERLQAMCDFANRDPSDAFLHPVVKAILLHFWLAYDHPFIDGNGRTARALFYWSMLSQGYWLGRVRFDLRHSAQGSSEVRAVLSLLGDRRERRHLLHRRPAGRHSKGDRRTAPLPEEEARGSPRDRAAPGGVRFAQPPPDRSSEPFPPASRDSILHRVPPRRVTESPTRRRARICSIWRRGTCS